MGNADVCMQVSNILATHLIMFLCVCVCLGVCIIDASAPILPCTLCVKGSIPYHTMCVRVFVWV